MGRRWDGRPSQMGSPVQRLSVVRHTHRLMYCRACEKPGWRVIAASGLEPRLDGLQVSVCVPPGHPNNPTLMLVTNNLVIQLHFLQVCHGRHSKSSVETKLLGGEKKLRSQKEQIGFLFRWWCNCKNDVLTISFFSLAAFLLPTGAWFHVWDPQLDDVRDGEKEQTWRW